MSQADTSKKNKVNKDEPPTSELCKHCNKTLVFFDYIKEKGKKTAVLYCQNKVCQEYRVFKY